jgi:crotonobetaine/carnitine-CoA ligase
MASIASVLADRAQSMGQKPWLRFLGGESFTYADFHQRALTVAAALGERGVKKGDRIATFLGNGPEIVLVWFAAHILGAVVVPLNNDLRGHILRHMLDLAAPSVIASHRSHLHTIHEIVGDSDYTERVVVVGDPSVNGDGWPGNIVHEPFDALLTHAAGDFVPEEIAAEEPCCIMYTSGTTGPSKGATYCNSFHLHMSDTCRVSMRYTDDDVLFTCLPLFHGNAINTTLVPALLAGAEVAVANRFSVSRFWDQIRESGATATNLLGAMSPMLLSREPSEAEGNHKLTRGLVIPAPPEYHQLFPERFGFQPVEAYGLSDGGMVLWAPLEDTRPGSCGRPVPGFECRVVDDRDHEVPRGTAGELVFRPLEPWITPLGYWSMPDATMNSWRNLWWHTGDLMRQDEDGWFFFVERAKDAIRRRGENISSVEVETAVELHPQVASCAAYAVPSDLMEDEVAIAVVLQPGAMVSGEELVRFVEDKLPYFAVPRFVRIVPDLPMTSTQKVQKQILRDEGIADCWDREAAGIRISR